MKKIVLGYVAVTLISLTLFGFSLSNLKVPPAVIVEAQVVPVLEAVKPPDPLDSYLNKHKDFIIVAKAIRNSCNRYGLDFKVILAIAELESGYGKSDIAKDKKNYFGLSAFDWDPYHNASDYHRLPIQEAIDMQVLTLKKDFFLKYTDLDSISRAYCSHSSEWYDSIKELIKEMPGDVE